MKTELELRYGNNPYEKKIKIIESVELKNITSESAMNLFNQVYPYLESLQDYKRAARIKKIEEKYLEDISV